MTDARSVGITRPSDNLYVAPHGQEMPAILLLMCKDHLTLAVVSFDGLVAEAGLGNAVKVQHRIDGAPAQEEIFISIGGPSQVGVTGKYAIPWIKALLQGRRLLVRVPMHPSSHTDFEFDLSGLDEAIKPVREACGW